MATTFVNVTLGPTETFITNGAAATGGAGYQDRFTVGGTWSPGDTITLTLTNTLTGLQTQIGAGYVTGVIPTFCFTFNQKVYALALSTAYFSAIDDATIWNNPSGNNNGFIQISDWYATAENLVAAAPYQGRLAFFSRFTTQIYIVDADVTKWQQQQVLTNIGTFAPFSVQNLGDLDVMFLSDTGIRSLRARDLTLNAFVNDLGSPIDSLIQANIALNGLTSSQNAQAVVDPQSGRYWIWLNSVIYVLSYYPTNQITAWSTYETTYDAMSPLLLTATAASTTQINLNWGGAVSDLGPVTYNLYRSTLSGFYPSATTLIASGLTGTTFPDAGLTGSTTYYYYAIGFDTNGGQVLSNEANATTQASGTQPGSFVLTATQDGTTPSSKINLSWTTPSGSTPLTYNVYRSTNPAFTPGSGNIIVTGQSGTTFSDTGLPSGTTEYYYVEAINSFGTSFSNEANASTAPLAPVLSLTFVSPNELDLSWTAVSGAVTYSVFRGTTSGGETLLVSGIASGTLSYHDTAVTGADSTNYYYYVASVSSGGSTNSNEVFNSVALIPIMFSDSTPSGTATASLTDPASTEYWAFDGAYHWKPVSGSFPEPVPSWVAYTFGGSITKKAITYHVSAGDNNGTSVSWQLQGSNGGTWTTLDTQANQDVHAGGGGQTYTIASPLSFQSYRLNITNYGTTNSVSMGFQLYGG